MQEISGQTGGTVYSPIDDRELDAAFTRISAELSDQYVLSYYPEDAEQAAQFRNIAVRVKTGKDLTVRTRKGYYVSRR
jgi:VWFA-related protein